jgi:chromosome segregation ATPase
LLEYKAAMHEVEELEHQAAALDRQNEILEHKNDDLEQKTSELCGQVQEMEEKNKELVLQAQKLTEQIEEAEVKEKAAKEVLLKHDLRAETFKMISKEVAAETKSMKSVVVPVTNLFGSEEYVKVKKSDWNKILDAFSKAASRNHLLEKYEKKISGLERKIDMLTDQVEKLKRFVASRGLGEAFVEIVKLLGPKTMKQRLEDAKSEADVHNRQREMLERGQAEKCKRWQQEV